FFFNNRNKFLNYQIFKHIRLFNNNIHSQEFTLERLECYKYKEYLKSVIILDCNEDEKIAKLNKILESLPNIKSLESPRDFNRELPQQEFTKLEAVTFGSHFNSGFVCCTLPVISIAENLTSLHFGDNFNQPIDLVLLQNLKTLSFGSNFNQKIKSGTLPDSLRILKFGAHYNQEMDNAVFPKSLESLTFSTCFNKKIFQKRGCSGSDGKGGIISSILGKTLCRSSSKKYYRDEVNLKSLEFGDYFNLPLKNIRLPSSLTLLKFGSNFNQKTFTTTPSITKFKNLTTLIFGNLYNQNIVYLPPSLVSLELSFHFNSIISASAIPSTLEKISFGYMYNKSLCCLKDSNVKTVILGTSFNQPLYTDVNKLVSNCIENENKSDLPSSLTHLDLSISTRFDQDIGSTLLNTSLITLKLHKNYKKLININLLPKSLNDLQSDGSSSSSTLTTSTIKSYDTSPNSKMEIQQMISTSSLLPISKIIFDKSFRQPIPPGSIKSNYLKTIDFRFLYVSPLLRPGSIPDGVETVSFNIYNIKLLKGILPASVKNLYISSYGLNPIIDAGTLPNTIEKIFIRHSEKPVQFKSISSLPSNLENIYCFNTNKSFIEYCLNHKFLYSYLKIIDYKLNKNQIM
ncbi:hypothetical protein DICPUDRAFT_28495, partial [Dictyostelium purpureum]